MIKSYRLYRADFSKKLRGILKNIFDMIFTNPPHMLSNCGITCQNGKIVFVNKEKRGKSPGPKKISDCIKNGVRANGTPASSEGEIWKHPTQKPTDLLERVILSATNLGDLVLGPFCCSGTANVAAIKLGCNFVGADKERSFINLSRERICDEFIKKAACYEKRRNWRG
jgi:DNA modification methylase